MSERQDVYVAARMILDASNLLYAYYPEISNPLLNVAKEILKRIDIRDDEELQKYVSILSEEDADQKRYENILRENDSAQKSFDALYNDYKNALIDEANAPKSSCSNCKNKHTSACECENVNPDIMETLLNIQKSVINKINTENSKKS